MFSMIYQVKMIKMAYQLKYNKNNQKQPYSQKHCFSSEMNRGEIFNVVRIFILIMNEVEKRKQEL